MTTWGLVADVGEMCLGHLCVGCFGVVWKFLEAYPAKYWAYSLHIVQGIHVFHTEGTGLLVKV